MTALLEAQNATRILDEAVKVTLVDDVSLSVGEGEFVAITGPSGSGKSSLLYLLGLLDLPTSGDVLIKGQATHDMTSDARARIRLTQLGFIFQFHFLLPEFTARQNVMLPMRRLNALPSSAQHQRAGDLLASLGLEGHIDKRPEQLSGGQRQRVAVARALANDPALILADEPTGSLDSKATDQVFSILRDLVDTSGRTILAVTHDMGLAGQMDRRIHLVDGALESDGASRGAD
ncbi:MAG: ABC transporter ATP-binding protein [Hyphomicrobiales bacterium]|jgi:lipoprotein-releasing system ATP-binding protein